MLALEHGTSLQAVLELGVGGQQRDDVGGEVLGDVLAR